MNIFGVAARIKILAGISFLLLLLVAVVGVTVINIEARSIRNIHETSLPGIVVIGKARLALMKVRVNIYQSIFLKDEQRAKALENLEKNRGEIRQQLDAYDLLPTNPEDTRLLEAERRAVQVYSEALDRAVAHVRQGREDLAAEVLSREILPTGNAVLEALNEHVEFNEKLAADYANAAFASAQLGRNVALGVSVLSLLIIAGFSIMLARELQTRLAHMSNFMTHVADSLDLTGRGKIVRTDELGKVGQAINLLMDKLTASLRSIAANADAVAASAERLATSSTQVATASSNQSEASSSVAATVEEMTVSINHVSDQAGEADRLAAHSEKLAKEGGAVILQTASDIHDIAESVRHAAELIASLEASSKQISGVVAVIRDVADQTNLLALNAAIEAARAGEQGRGFAVVADEVRKLAERTGHSTQEIASTIETMNEKAARAVSSMNRAVSKVDVGVQRARDTSASIQLISDGCHDAGETVGEISNAIREQGTATNNIAAQIERIAQMSEESSAAAGETAEAARGLDELARRMRAEVSRYRLNELH
ncbi:methyl-accepting chemotaxis protein [Uliginosibacterium paludis]|uniref:Methyl-accepting chemotaxis protein n=1 Tax=Uliginosibacterium paludis TaxID=1615952 RepID=A0ABV2CVX9_9RHOO